MDFMLKQTCVWMKPAPASTRALSDLACQSFFGTNTVAGVPIFMFGQAARQLGRTGLLAVRGRRQWLRQAMNFTYAVGAMVGHHLRVRRPS